MLSTYLQEKYYEISRDLGITESAYGEKLNAIIKEELRHFMQTHSVVAIFGNGEHTRMLTVDYIYELKNVQYIIDNGKKQEEYGGYKIIDEKELEKYGIDGVIISSIKYRTEMAKSIQNNYKAVDYLDFYEKFEEQGIYLNTAYYRYWYPANHYLEISRLQEELKCTIDFEKRESVYLQLLRKYIEIKDFRLAELCVEKMNEIYDKEEYREIGNKIKALYHLELQAAAEIHENNVLILCVDGLRRKDYMAGLLPDIKAYCDDNMTFFANAYACSTSTYESLVPAFSENDNLQTNYFESSEIDGKECRFIQEAEKQERNIYFYTDSATYIRNDHIRRNNSYLTAAEKIWYFLLDAVEEKNGLFYIHIGYESHFPYVNPYTIDHLIADGTNIMFDYLPRLGGKVRTNYMRQQQDSLRYLDNLLVPFIKELEIRMVVFADHGNILLEQKEKLEDVCATKFSYHEDLIQIPLLIKSPEQGNGQNNSLVSLMSINDIIICLLQKVRFSLKHTEVIKTERSAIYNPDFQYLYRQTKNERELQAYEAFVFTEGYKLAVYSDGEAVAFALPDDREIEEREIKQTLIEQVENRITVCESVKL